MYFVTEAPEARALVDEAEGYALSGWDSGMAVKRIELGTLREVVARGGGEEARWTPQDAIDMHRPEKWGYVEFAHELREPKRDETWPARELLMELYYQHKAGLTDYVIRGVRECPDYEIERDPWRATVNCAGQKLSIDATGLIRTG